MYIGNKLRAIRLTKAIKQEQMAQILGLSSSGYSKLERNAQESSQKRIEDYAFKLGVQPEELLDLHQKYIQNINAGDNNQNVTHYYAFTPEMKNAYESQIAILKDLVQSQKEQIQMFKEVIDKFSK